MIDKVIGMRDVVLLMLAAFVIGVLKYATDQRDMVAWIVFGILIGMSIVLVFMAFFGDVGIMVDENTPWGGE